MRLHRLLRMREHLHLMYVFPSFLHRSLWARLQLRQPVPVQVVVSDRALSFASLQHPLAAPMGPKPSLRHHSRTASHIRMVSETLLVALCRPSHRYTLLPRMHQRVHPLRSLRRALQHFDVRCL